jgi:hypothetical protein
MTPSFITQLPADGADGGCIGFTGVTLFDAAEAGPVPTLLVALTVKV